MELTDLDLDILGLGFRLQHADARDFGVGVNDTGDDIVIHVTSLAGDDLRRRHAFFFGLVGKHRTRDDVTNGVNAWEVSAEMVVDDNAAALIEFEASFRGTETLSVRLTTNGDEDLVGWEFKRLTIAFCRKGHATSAFLDAGYLSTELELDALLFESLLGDLGDVFIISRSTNGGEHFHDRDLGAEAGPDGAEFQADGTRTNDHHLFGDALEGDAVVG